MKGINENNKDKYNRVELLNPEEKQTIIISPTKLQSRLKMVAEWSY